MSHSNCDGCQDHNTETPISKQKHTDPIKKFIPMVISFIIYTSSTLISVNILSDYYDSPLDRYNSKFFHYFALGSVLISTLMSVITKPNQTDIHNAFRNEQKRLVPIQHTKFPKKCEFCVSPKFERSSHCSQCDFCVLRRDHHCVWIGQCVGYQNNQYFMNQLIWASIMSFSYFKEFINYYNTKSFKLETDPEHFYVSYFNVFFIYMVFLISCIANFFLTIMFISQVFSLYNETTQYERTRNDNYEYYFPFCSPSNNNEKTCAVYNKGFILNFTEIIGPTILHWIFPLPKFSKFDLHENNLLFRKLKFPHTFQVRQHLTSGTPALSHNEESDMDPHVFMKLSETRYKDVTI